MCTKGVPTWGVNPLADHDMGIYPQGSTHAMVSYNLANLRRNMNTIHTGVCKSDKQLWLSCPASQICDWEASLSWPGILNGPGCPIGSTGSVIKMPGGCASIRANTSFYRL